MTWRSEPAPTQIASDLSPYIAQSIRDRTRTRDLERQQIRAIAKATGINPDEITQRISDERTAKKTRTKRYLRDTTPRAQPGATLEPIDRHSLTANATCYLCGEPIEPSDVHLDHVIPLSRGGDHTVANLKPTHSRCNLSKGSKTPAEYLDTIR